MARNFTNQEAREVAQKHRDLLKQLQLVIKAYEEERKVANLIYTKLLRAGEIEKQASDDLNSNNYRIRPDIQELIIELFRCRKFNIAQAACKRILDEHKEDIEFSIESLQPATGSIRWFFTGNENQNKAVRAYEQLNALLNSEYSENVKNATGILSKSVTPSFDVAYKDMRSNLKLYRSLFHSIMSGSLQAEPEPVSAISDCLKKQSRINQVSDEIVRVIELKNRLIKNAADKCLAKEALNILDEVPVEEVNHQGGGGIRVKALRDHGYETMADLYTASVYELASVRGISQETAYEIRRIVKSFAQTSQNSAYIRLNSDDRNKDATDLVRELCAYRNIKGSVDTVNALNAEYGDKVRKAAADLRKIGDGTDWLFYSDEEKQYASKELKYIKAAHAGKYASVISDALKMISSQAIFSEDQAWADFRENSITYYNILERIIPGILGGGDSAYGLPDDLARAIQDEAFFPDGLLCDLRPYQELGVKYTLHQEKVLLGDEMGLGKTIQAIATMVSLRNTGATHFVVVCPASVLSNWCREIQRHSKLRATRVHGAGRSLAIKSWMKTGGVAVTTYETTPHFKLPEDFRYDLLVVDEAHYIKNKKAKRTQNVIKLSEHTGRLLFMTGTALENRVDEMISLISDLQPATARKLLSMAFMSTAPQFREAAAPVYYRRKRDDVLKELPELIENEDWCIMTPQEEEIYERAVLSKSYADARRVSWNLSDLRYSSKARRLMELVEDAADDERKVIVFSFFLDTIRKIREMLGDKCYGPINGSVPPEKRQLILDEFHKAPPGSVLVAQIQSGGTGLNIQDASVVIICEPQLKPSTENQAVARAHRMGQDRSVLVHRLLCEDTIDERITDMLTQKQAVFDAFADKSAAGEEGLKNLEIDSKTLGAIIQEEIDRINEKNGNMPVVKQSKTELNEEVKEHINRRLESNPSKTVANRPPTSGNAFEIITDASKARKEPRHDAAVVDVSSNDNKNRSEGTESGSNKRERHVTDVNMDSKKIETHKTVAAGHSSSQNDATLVDYLRKRKFNVVDNQKTSGILWVVFDSREEYVLYKERLERVFDDYNATYAYESRGALATNGKPAYRVMARKG